MKDVNTNINVHFEKDKALVPFLMTCTGVDYLGIERRGDVVFFKFSPNDLVNKEIDRFYKRTADSVQPKDLLDAVQRFKTEIFRATE